MNDKIKSWVVTYKHPMTGETVKGIEHAETKPEASKKAMAHNTPISPVSHFFWVLESVEELTDKEAPK